jgi:hypothetical protein
MASTTSFLRRALPVLTLLLFLPMVGPSPSQATVGDLSARLDLAESADTRADTPRVSLRLARRRVTIEERTRVTVVLRPRSSFSRAQVRSLRSARVKVRVRGPGVRRLVTARATGRRVRVVLRRMPAGIHRVRAVFPGNALLGRARSPIRRLTVVAAAGGGGDGGGGGGGEIPADFPHDTNAGVPPGTVLTPYSGSSTIDRAGTVIEDKILGCVRVTAPGVVIRRSRLSCGGQVVVGSYDGDYTGAPLLLEDVEIDCGDGPGTAVGDANVVVRRADISGCENGFDLNQAVTIADSYIHDLWNGGDAHLDGIQLASAHLVGSEWVKGALDITIRHNTIYGVGADGSLGTSAIISNPVGDENILIENNLLAGGAVALYCDYEGTATNYRVIDNRFSRRFSSKVGAYGPSTGCSDETLSGNVYHETGLPVRLD